MAAAEALREPPVTRAIFVMAQPCAYAAGGGMSRLSGDGLSVAAEGCGRLAQLLGIDSGSSKGAKWPPRAGSVTRTTLVVRRARPAAGGRFAGEQREAGRHLDPAGELRRRDRGVRAVHAHRRADGPREPVDRDVREDLVLREAPLESPAQSLHARSFSTIHAASPAGESVSPKLRSAASCGALRRTHPRWRPMPRRPRSRRALRAVRSAGSPAKKGSPPSVRWTATTRSGWSSAR